jgi:hypothetical protein
MCHNKLPLLWPKPNVIYFIAEDSHIDQWYGNSYITFDAGYLKD